MVATRRKSCSSSESDTVTSAAPPAAKLKKQDDGTASPAPRTSPRGVDASGTSAAAPSRPSGKVTDSLLVTAPLSPRISRTTRSRNNSSAQDPRTPVKTTLTDSSIVGTVDSRGVRQLRSSDSSGVQDTRTPVTRRRGGENSSHGTDNDILGGKQLHVTLKDISMSTTPSTRSRRVSGSEAGGPHATGDDADVKSFNSNPGDVAGTPTATTATTISTPVRRSRRLSGGKAKETPSQDTPKQLSLSSVRFKREEGKETKEAEGNKQNTLSVIKEEAECKFASPGSSEREAKEHSSVEEKINTIKSDPEAQTGNDKETEKCSSSGGQTVNDAESSIPDLPMSAEDKESSCLAPVHKEAESKDEHVEDQTVDSKKCNGTPSIQNTTDCTEGEKKDTEVTETTCDDEQHKTTSSDVGVESANELKSKEEEQNNAISTSNSMEVAANPAELHSPKDTCKTVPDDDLTKESSTTQDTRVTSSAPLDENGNKNVNGLNPLMPQIMAGDKKLLKVIPELEKKIQQIRSVPKGQHVSGKWWKKEKQRFRSINKDASGKKKWSKKMQLKQWRGDVMARSAAIEAEKQKKKEDLKERQKLNKIRREENAKKAEIVQVIKDPRKIKKMKRKQLRYIETRDTTSLKQV